MSLSKKLKYNKLNESDQQMLIRISTKFAIFFVVIFLFDTILDLLSGLIDHALELLHLIIEFFEYSLVLLLEHILNANHHESDIMIVNFAIILGLYGIYRFCLDIPRLFVWSTRRTKAAWLKRKRREVACWRSLPLKRKVKVCITYLTGASCILFLIGCAKNS